MIYFLGGPPRVGKSVIAGEIGKKFALSVVSTDTLGAVLASVLSPEAAPDLFVFDRLHEKPMADQTTFIQQNPAAFMNDVRKESRVVWKAVEAFIQRENEEGRDALIEGVAILPELVRQMEGIPHQAVFVGNQGQNHIENIKKSVQENKHDWMRNMSDEYIHAFAEFVRRMSEYIEHEARKSGYGYIEMDNMPFNDVTNMVEQSLRLYAK
jgi:2-phosphoglycerate kinase